MTARTTMMPSFYDATTNLVNGCIPGREGRITQQPHDDNDEDPPINQQTNQTMTRTRTRTRTWTRARTMTDNKDDNNDHKNLNF